MQPLIIVLFVTLLFILLYYHWRRRHLYILASKLPGPVALPFVGNGLSFLCRSEDILKIISDIQSTYAKPLRFWFGPILVIYFSAPQHIEKILSSSKLAYKHNVYSILQIYLGDGLVSSLGGPKYRKHRRLIQPLINLKFTTGNIEAFQRHINLMMQKMDVHINQGTFDIHDLIHNCFADIIGESILGTKIDAQLGKNSEYIQATMDAYQVGHSRLMRPWLHPNVIYSYTSGKKHQDHIVNVTTTFIKKAVDRARSRIKMDRSNENVNAIPIIDQIAEAIENDPDCMNDEDFLYHMFTLYLASEDTMTVITAILCVCFGMYPEYQKKAVQEIREVFGESPRDVTYEDLTKLQYIDMCIRDVLRLIPIAPIIIRKTIEDFQIDKWTIPKDCGVLVSIFDVHRDPAHWENPNHFHPDHFLPEAVRKRHPYAYVPFSAGPRSCVGKILAFIGLKLIIANILQRFEIEADGKFPNIVLRSDITVRSLSGYKVRIKKRIWK